MDKLNPRQLFVVSTVSRSTIAKMLNDALNEKPDSAVKRFSASDPRLTDAVCKRFADALHQADMDDMDEDSLDYAGFAAADLVLAQLFAAK